MKVLKHAMIVALLTAGILEAGAASSSGYVDPEIEALRTSVTATVAGASHQQLKLMHNLLDQKPIDITFFKHELSTLARYVDLHIQQSTDEGSGDEEDTRGTPAFQFWREHSENKVFIAQLELLEKLAYTFITYGRQFVTMALEGLSNPKVRDNKKRDVMFLVERMAMYNLQKEFVTSSNRRIFKKMMELDAAGATAASGSR